MTVVPGFTIADPPSLEALSKCVQCGLCLNVCPTFRELRVETESPRGRLYLMRALGEGRLEPTDTVVEHLDRCLDCRACEAACPSGVEYGQLMEATRAELLARRPPRWPVQLYRQLVFRWLLASPGRLATLGRLLRAYQRSKLGRLVRRLLPPRLAAAEQLLPPLSGRFFDPAEVPPPPEPAAALFAGCIMRVCFADTHRATLRLLTRAGLAVAAPPGQVCCGALQLHAGERELAQELARRNVALFERWPGATIVVNAAGCGATLKEYGQLLAHDPEFALRAAAFSARVRDLSEALTGCHDAPAAPEQPATLAVAYQDACHLAQAQRIRSQPRQLLSRLPGVKLVELKDPEQCCGSAGIYNLTQPELAARLLARKIETIAASGAQVVVSTNPGCLIQLRAGLDARGLPIRTVHLADFLDGRST
jgi:glycolate dehydrogenase iron-sulfur subunit